MADRKFKVELSAVITDVTSGKDGEFAEFKGKYSDVPLIGVLGMEKAIADGLIGLGVAGAELQGAEGIETFKKFLAQ